MDRPENTPRQPTIFPLGSGIQRTLEALVKGCPPTGSRCSLPLGVQRRVRCGGAIASSAVRPSSAGRRRVATAVDDAIEASGAQVVLFGATYPLALLGPRLQRRGIPTFRRRTGSSTGCRWPQERIP